MAMNNLPHPGRSIRENCLVPLGLNVTEATKVLVVARHTLSRVLNGHAAVSPEMAIRLEKAGWSNHRPDENGRHEDVIPPGRTTGMMPKLALLGMFRDGLGYWVTGSGLSQAP